MPSPGGCSEDVSERRRRAAVGGAAGRKSEEDAMEAEEFWVNLVIDFEYGN